MKGKKIIALLVSWLLLSPGWLSLTGLTLPFALVPMLWLSAQYDSSRRSWWRMAAWAALCFGGWSALTTWWIWYATPIGPILSVLITATLCGGAFMLYHTVSKRAPKALAYTILCAAWIAAEYWYTVGEVSFPWLTLGNGLANDIRAVQWYEFTGVFGGSLWVLLCNILIWEALSMRRRGLIVAAATVLVLPPALSLALYASRHGAGREITATVVQPNISVFPYRAKYLLSERQQDSIALSLIARAPADVDFIVLPETAVAAQSVIWEEHLTASPSLQAMQRVIDERYPAAMIITGASTARMYPAGTAPSPTARRGEGYYYDIYNTALALVSGGGVELYHKSKLVVGVEKMPYPRLMEKLRFLIVDLGGTTGQLGVDAERKVFGGGEARIGAAICYEGIYGEFFAGFVRQGAEVMAIISNDGWWGDTPGHRQLFAFSRLRAVETRRSIARSANTGTSGFIDPRGDVIEKIGWDVRTAATERLSLGHGLTFYVRYGDYVARIACYLLLLSLLYYAAYRVRRRNHLVD